MATTLDILPHAAALELLDQQMQAHQQNDDTCALLLISIDRFKEINIIHGYQAGDALLDQVCTRIGEMSREHDIIQRIGSAKFMMLLPHLPYEGVATMAALRLQQCFEQPFDLAGANTVARAKIGIALYPTDAESPADLYRNAEIALINAAKTKDGYCLHDAGKAMSVSSNWDIFSDLRSAIIHNEFELHFQPQISLKDGSLIGAEALLRWTHPQRGNIPPGDFIPLAEQSEFIHQITEWTLRNALWALREWPDNDLATVVSVNISSRSLLHGDLVRIISQAEELFDADLSRLALEVTETALMEDMDSCIETIKELKSMGIRISIDDFGTGYSSMSYFRHIPADELKIDQSFVRNLPNSPIDEHIIRSIVELSKGFGLEVVAEGVEDAETFELLDKLGCDIAQGWHVARPMPLDKFIEWINNRS